MRSGAANPVRQAVRHAALPLGLATATTAVGLLSLWFSDLLPIRLFGLFSAIGVVVTLALQLVLLPALLTVWHRAGRRMPNRNDDDEHDDAIEHLSPAWQRLIRVRRERRHAWCAGICLLALAVGAMGLLRVETSIQVMRLFSPDTPIIASYAWLEEHLGALVPLEVIVRFDQTNEEGMLQRLQLVRKLEESIKQSAGVGGCLSGGDICSRSAAEQKLAARIHGQLHDEPPVDAGPPAADRGGLHRAGGRRGAVANQRARRGGPGHGLWAVSAAVAGPGRAGLGECEEPRALPA